MTLRFSDAYRNFLNAFGSEKQALAGGKLNIYTGTQPSSANDAVTGTLLCTFTASGGAHTAGVQAAGSVELTGGGSGSVDTLTVNSIEIMGSATAYNTSLAQTAQDIVDKINNNPKNLLFIASRSSSTIIITAKPGLGTLANGWVVASTVTTITKTDTNLSGGVNSANGLTLGTSTTGAMVKNPAQTWQATGLTNGTAGWFRFVGEKSDAGGADSSATYIRVDGSIATSGADMNWSNTSIVTSAVQTLDEFTLTYPAS